MLQVQYRMNKAIMEFSNHKFYEGKLIAADAFKNHSVFEEDQPLLFIDTAGCGFEEKQVGTSISNPEEAIFLINYLQLYIQEITKANLYPAFPSIGIIAPYKGQLDAIREVAPNSENIQPGMEISINSVDSFQGQERDVILISMTRSNTDSRIGFLNEIRRMNVAMTRARKKLVIVGDSSTLSQHSFYAGLIEFTQNRNAYKSAWEYF